MKNKPIQSPQAGPNNHQERDEVDVEVVAKPKRRRFTAEYKLRILAEIDAAPRGERGAIIRREGLYSSNISEWRTARENAVKVSLSQKRGPKPKSQPERTATKRIAQLERRLARSEDELRKARIVIEVQGKVAGLLGPMFKDESD